MVKNFIHAHGTWMGSCLEVGSLFLFRCHLSCEFREVYLLPN